MSPLRTSPKTERHWLLAAALLLTLTGCLGYVDRPRGGNGRGFQSARVQPGFVGQDDYVYYPAYQMYYGSRSRQYYYQDGSAWVAQPAPARVAVSVLVATPSVQMEFHDSPAAHHAQVIRTYPATWAPNHGNNDRKNDERR